MVNDEGNQRESPTRMQFGDLVNAKLTNLAIRPRDFAIAMGIPVAELDRLLENRPVAAEWVFKVLESLGWSGAGARATLASLPEIPVKGGSLVPSSTSSKSVGVQVGRGLLNAWMDPGTMRIERIEILAPDLMPSLGDPAARDRLLGDGWKSRYSIEYIAELQRLVQIANRGEIPPVMYGLNGNGLQSSVRCLKDGDRVLVRYEQLPENVRAIGPRWKFAAFNGGKFQVSARPDAEVPSRED